MDILKQLAEEFKIRNTQVENTVKLIDDGNTIPFISRYRKEMTGGLDDQLLRELSERLTYLRNLESRKEEVKSLKSEDVYIGFAVISVISDLALLFLVLIPDEILP